MHFPDAYFISLEEHKILSTPQLRSGNLRIGFAGEYFSGASAVSAIQPHSRTIQALHVCCWVLAQVTTKFQIKRWPLLKDSQDKIQAVVNISKPFSQYFCKQKIKKHPNKTVMLYYTFGKVRKRLECEVFA